MVGFMKRYAPVYRVARDEATSGEFGPVVFASGTSAIGSLGPDPDPFVKIAAVHHLDLLRFFVGNVHHVGGVVKVTSHGVAIELSYLAESGAVGTLNLVGLPAWARHFEEFVVSTSTAYWRCDEGRALHRHHDRPTSGVRWQTIDEVVSTTTPVDTTGAGGHQALYLNGYVGELTEFIECVQEGRPPANDAADNVETMSLCDAVLHLPVVHAEDDAR
jgi:predicted dehydrogenase